MTSWSQVPVCDTAPWSNETRYRTKSISTPMSPARRKARSGMGGGAVGACILWLLGMTASRTGVHDGAVPDFLESSRSQWRDRAGLAPASVAVTRIGRGAYSPHPSWEARPHHLAARDRHRDRRGRSRPPHVA